MKEGRFVYRAFDELDEDCRRDALAMYASSEHWVGAFAYIVDTKTGKMVLDGIDEETGMISADVDDVIDVMNALARGEDPE